MMLKTINHLISQTKFAEAEKLSKEYCKKKPACVQGQHLHCLALIMQGKCDEAEQLLLYVLDHFGENASTYYLFANLYFQKQKYPLATQWAKKALGLDPRVVGARYYLAASQFSQSTAEAHLGVSLRLQRVNEAIESLLPFLKENPQHADALSLMSKMLSDKWDYATAIQYMHRAISINPSNGKYYADLGLMYMFFGRYHEAFQCYRKAEFLDVDPGTKYAYLLLLHGDLWSGFCRYEYRLIVSRAVPKFNSPLWRGEKIDGKTLLISHEEGYGDTIQFLRYLPLLKQFNCKIIAVVQDSLFSLFQDSDFSFTTLSQIPPHDFHLYVMSLAHIFRTDLTTIPLPVPPKNISLQPVRRRIGLVWRGDPDHEVFKKRSLTLEEIEPLLKIKDLEYVCLQKDLNSQEIEMLQKYAIKQPLLNTWQDTAKELSKCELLVTADTGIAHLAGTMGLPTWVFISKVPDWRWLLNRSDSAWYPSIQLFRQTILDQWDEPIESVRSLLERRASGKP